jgi:hypothetical protein
MVIANGKRMVTLVFRVKRGKIIVAVSWKF